MSVSYVATADFGPDDLDLNGPGNVHGGELLRLLDEYGAFVARQYAQKEMVTRALTGFDFYKPVPPSPTISCEGILVDVGTRSLTIDMALYGVETGEPYAEGTFVYVAVDDDHQATAIHDV